MKTIRLRCASARRAKKTLTKSHMKTIHLRCATMRQATLVLVLFLTAFDLWAQMPPSSVRTLPSRNRATNNSVTATPLPNSPAPTVSAIPQQPKSSTTPALQENEIPGYSFNYEGVDVNQVLDIYAGLVGRTLLRASISSPPIILKTQAPLTSGQALRAW